MTGLRPLAYHGCRLLLGGVFLYAGLVKSADVRGFALQLADYRLLPDTGSLLVAASLPSVEFLAGLLLLANRKVRPAALLLGALLLVFMAVLGLTATRGLDVNCGCFRSAGHTTPLQALLRDGGLLALAAVTFWLRGRPSIAAPGKERR